jgi:microcystin-dependent protein
MGTYITTEDFEALIGLVSIGDGIYSVGKTYTSYGQFLRDGNNLYVMDPNTQVPYTVDLVLYPQAALDPNLLAYELGNIALTPVIEERVTVTNGQTVVSFTSAITSQASIYIDNKGDAGRITDGIGYTVLGPNTIQLYNSYPDGTVVIAINNDMVAVPSGYVRERATKLAMSSDLSFAVGDMCMTAGAIEPTDGEGATYVMTNDAPTANDVEMDNGLTASRQERESLQLSYDNTESGLESTNIQDAVDELAYDLENIPVPPVVTGFTGQRAMSYGVNAPTGWLKSNGDPVSRTTYADLWAVIGATYGNGDGSTTFNLPDDRAEFARGWDDGKGVDDGRVLGSHQDEAMGPHTHVYQAQGGANSTHVKADHVEGSGSDADRYGRNYTTNENSGSETRPRNNAYLVVIKT